MRHTDIAIIGGGLAGATAAAMLGKAGIAAVLVDPNPVYPADFRVEKLSGLEQVGRFEKTGLSDATMRRTAQDGINWIARFGRLLDRSPSHQFGILYDDLVNSIRAQIPAGVAQIFSKAVAITTSADRQVVTLANGDQIDARLVIMANGLNVGLRHALGIERDIKSECHSISFGFDIAPVGHRSFDFRAMTYFSEKPSDRAPYIAMFPVGERTRANLFLYREADDPLVRQMRKQPVETLHEIYPRLKALTGDFAVTTDVKVRPVDLYVSRNHIQPGVVLVGDAYQTTCPVTGTGTDKVFTDVVQLCETHIPRWLATPGMDADKIATFYADPVKMACDAWSNAKAYNFRSMTIERGLRWTLQRWARFGVWYARGLKRRMLAVPPPAANDERGGTLAPLGGKN